MSCDGNRHKYFQHIAQTSKVKTALGGNAALVLDRIYESAKAAAPTSPAAAERMMAEANTRFIFAKIEGAVGKAPTHSKDGLPKQDSQFGYSAVYQTLDAINRGQPLPSLAAGIVKSVAGNSTPLDKHLEESRQHLTERLAALKGDLDGALPDQEAFFQEAESLFSRHAKHREETLQRLETRNYDAKYTATLAKRYAAATEAEKTLLEIARTNHQVTTSAYNTFSESSAQVYGAHIEDLNQAINELRSAAYGAAAFAPIGLALLAIAQDSAWALSSPALWLGLALSMLAVVRPARALARLFSALNRLGALYHREEA